MTELEKKVVQLRDYYTKELDTLDSFDRSCCDQAEYETIESVVIQLNYILYNLKD